MSIHGKCTHYYCEYCMKKSKVVENVLKESCDDFLKFNAFEYRLNAKQRGVINDSS